MGFVELRTASGHSNPALGMWQVSSEATFSSAEPLCHYFKPVNGMWSVWSDKMLSPNLVFTDNNDPSVGTFHPR